MRQKINESLDEVVKIKSGIDLPIENFLPSASEHLNKTQRSADITTLSGNPAKTTARGLPIFQNASYLTDLKRLLSSEDLNECYDYDKNDESYKKLYECLTSKQKLLPLALQAQQPTENIIGKTPDQNTRTYITDMR